MYDPEVSEAEQAEGAQGEAPVVDATEKDADEDVAEIDADQDLITSEEQAQVEEVQN